MTVYKAEAPHSGYKLAQYLESDAYTLIGTAHKSYATVCKAVAPTDLPQVLAIDGPTNSGKSSFTAAMIDFCETRDIPVTLLPLDYFLTDRPTRNRVFQAIVEKELDITGYSHAAWEHDKYQACLAAARQLLAQATKPEELVVPNTYNRLTGRKEEDRKITVHPGGLLLTEGVGLHTHSHGLFDKEVRVDVSDDTVLLQRVLQRERQKPPGTVRLDDAYLEWRYNLVDEPHTAHLRATSSGRADFVVDTSNFDSMLVYKK